MAVLRKLEEITGASKITDFCAAGTSWYTFNYNSSLYETSYTSKNATANVLGTLKADLAVGDDVVLSSYTNAADKSGKQTLVADHAMSVYGYDSATGMLEIRNPWGTMAGQYWDTTFEVGLSTLLTDGDTITADNVGTRTGSPAPTVTAQTTTPTRHANGSSDLSASETFASMTRLTQAMSSFAPDLGTLGTGETKFDAVTPPNLALPQNLFGHH